MCVCSSLPYLSSFYFFLSVGSWFFGESTQLAHSLTHSLTHPLAPFFVVGIFGLWGQFTYFNFCHFLLMPFSFFFFSFLFFPFLLSSPRLKERKKERKKESLRTVLSIYLPTYLSTALAVCCMSCQNLFCFILFCSVAFLPGTEKYICAYSTYRCLFAVLGAH